MSVSNPNENLVNPASKFFEWDAENGRFNYFDKSKGEKGEQVIVEFSAKKPFMFIPLDTLVTLKGYNKPEKTGYWSNEIRQFDTKTQFVVRSKNGVEATGNWESVKAKLSTKGLKYCNSIYIGFKDEKGVLQLNNVKLKGTALSAWMDFVKKNNVESIIGVAVKGSKLDSSGKIPYHIPIFELVPITKNEIRERAIELDKTLQEHLKLYLAKNSNGVPQEEKAAQNDQNQSSNKTHQEPEVISQGQDVQTQDNTSWIDDAESPF